MRYAAAIHSSSSDLLALINDILDWSKVEAGQMDVQFAPTSVDSILQTLHQTFTPVAESKGLAFVTEHGENVPQYFVTDTQRLLQVLRNLLANAFKFTEHGSMTVATQRAGENAVRFEVRDTGIGIAREKQEMIFQAFQQADGTTSRKYGGSGLGLSISREFSRLLGGSVLVSSELGRGSVFAVTLPIAAREGIVTAKLDTIGHMKEPEPAAVVVPPPAPPAQAFETQPIADDRADRKRPDRAILVIEDNLHFARIFYELAHELDFDCVHATNATQGVELAREMQPNVILLDIGLLDQSGP